MPDFRLFLCGLSGLLALGASTALAAPQAPDTALARELAMTAGQYAPDTGLFEKGPLATRLRQELGARYATFLSNMEVAGPLQPAGDLLFITGNRQHEGGSRIAWLLTDRQGVNMTVGILDPGRLDLLTTGPTPLTKPADIRAMLENMGVVAPLCNPAQDLAPGRRLHWHARMGQDTTCIYRVGLHRGEQVTARLEPAASGLDMRVIDPHPATAMTGPVQSWYVPEDDLYLVQVTQRPQAKAGGARAFSLSISARP
ncbi:hypothetical protein CFR78_01910 [Komagataeibacter rhaeticus]|uniref:hypothetical protein n=1 Tax=Komagataeibacter rhaeticus TaxID=215221 RepID=UPI0004D3720A|nr:hypothetical protein [Komagataeibacter rhaeticus]KDU94923.1 hypothetical protein GLUCORHAEAF1_11620 [Komagataeibacter rhaeticus AF1]MBL7239838.1 hypothetical protein [Komagataeibacter rhaeticus]PYD55167.1 hypothetical protein CFR78_01910 [Komagataeibacter rhaeticus]GBQ16611.1 hypothetical protein AA16663_2470 [Komagataeibacter rhaeticus DSM 16663]